MVVVTRPLARVPILMLVQIILLPLGTPFELMLSSSTVRASMTASQETGFGRCGIRTRRKATEMNHVGEGASRAISGAKLQGDKDGCCWEGRLSRRGLFDAGAMGAGVTWFAVPSQVQAGLPESMKYSREIPCILADSRVFLRAGRQFEVQQEMADSKSTGGSTGTSVWEASVVLSEFMQSGLPEGFWHGKRVLELGAGAGFTSILAASLGAKQVVASDGNSRVLQLAEKNAAANLAPAELRAIDFSQLRWEDAADPSWKFEQGSNFDVILAADVTYDIAFVPLLTQVIKRLGAPTAEIFLAHTTRSSTNGVDQSLSQFSKDFQVERIEVLSRGVAECRDGHKPTAIFRLRNLTT